MELELKRLQDTILEFNIKDEDHTLLNVLRQILSEEMPEVQVAAYKALQHTKPKFYIRVQHGEDPIATIARAAENLIQKCDDLIVQIKNLPL
jgi:DNA-directed RNA polymerase subunit L